MIFALGSCSGEGGVSFHSAPANALGEYIVNLQEQIAAYEKLDTTLRAQIQLLENTVTDYKLLLELQEVRKKLEST